MTLPPIPVAEPALRAFLHRRDWLRRNPLTGAQVAEGGSAEQRLRPWAAIALRCGADPAAVSPDAPAALEDYRKAGLTDAEARACVADDLCSLADLRAELARARDAALDAISAQVAAGGSATRSAPASTADLCILANYLGCPGYHPAPREKEAA